MAKVTKIETRGTKLCPKCENRVPVRKGTCDCGYVFVKKVAGAAAPAAKTPGKKRGRKPGVKVAPPMDFVTTLALITNVRALATELGGVEKALATVDRVNTLVNQLGVDGLKTALTATAEPVVTPVVTAPVVATPVVATPVVTPPAAKAPAKKKAPAAAAPAAKDDESPAPGETPVAPAAPATPAAA